MIMMIECLSLINSWQIKGCGGTELIAPRSFKYALNEKPKRNRMQVPIISEIGNVIRLSSTCALCIVYKHYPIFDTLVLKYVVSLMHVVSYVVSLVHVFE